MVHLITLLEMNMRITRFDPTNFEETQSLTKKYCMPMDSKKFIKWRGKVRRTKKNGGSVTIETDTMKYFKQIQGFYNAKYQKNYTLDDVATICQLRFMAARRSLINAEKNRHRLSDYHAVVIILNKIMSDTENLYCKVMAKIEDLAYEKFKADMAAEEEEAA